MSSPQVPSKRKWSDDEESEDDVREYNEVEDVREYNEVEEEVLPIPVVDERAEAIDLVAPDRRHKSRSYWIKVPLFRIMDENRHEDILDVIVEALKKINKIRRVSVMQSRVQDFDHEPRLYWMFLVQCVRHEDRITAVSIFNKLEDSKLTKAERNLVLVGTKNGRRHTNMKVLYEQLPDVPFNPALDAVLRSYDVVHPRLEWDQIDCINWIDFEYELAHSIITKARHLQSDKCSLQESERMAKDELSKDTTVFMTRGEAVQRVLQRQNLFANLTSSCNMDKIVRRYWRVQPRYDRLRFNTQGLGEGTDKERSLFDEAEAEHVADLESRFGYTYS